MAITIPMMMKAFVTADPVPSLSNKWGLGRGLGCVKL
jgi:hypothetical protein